MNYFKHAIIDQKTADVFYNEVKLPIFILNIVQYTLLGLGSLFVTVTIVKVFYGAFFSLILTTSFISFTRNIFDFTNSYGACLYGLYLNGFFQTALLIFGSGLEISLLFERSLYFSPSSFKNMKIVVKSKKI